MSQAGYTPIQLYYSTTASTAPSAGNLANGELAINITDGKLFYKDNGGNVQVLATKGAGTIGGSNTQVQYNSSGALAGSANLTFDGTTLTANALTVSNAVTLSGGTANGVAYLNGSKVLTTGSALTFDGANLGIGTSSPSYKLDVAGDIALKNNATYLFGKTSGGTATRLIGINSGNDLYVGSIDAAIGNINFTNNGTVQAVLNSSGNLGLGVTPSAWGAIYKAIELGGYASIANYSASNNSALALFCNAYDSGNGTFKYKNTAAATEYLQQAGAHYWYTAPSGTAGNAITFTQAMTLDASGRLGIGTTSPSSRLDVNYAGNGSAVSAFRALADNGQILLGNAGTFDSYLDSNQWIFRTSPQNGQVERARIDSSGNLLVGTTSNPGGSYGSEALVVRRDGNVALFSCAAGGSGSGTCVNTTRVSSGFHHVFFQSGTKLGDISTNGSSTSYNTSSDYRLKENIAPMTGALAKVQALKPCTYKWKADGSDGEGFIAHELAEVVPQCVTGEKDAVDAEGNPVYQGIDTSFLVATLTAAIQELKASLDEVKLEFDAYKAAHP